MLIYVRDRVRVSHKSCSCAKEMSLQVPEYQAFKSVCCRVLSNVCLTQNSCVLLEGIEREKKNILRNLKKC